MTDAIYEEESTATAANRPARRIEPGREGWNRSGSEAFRPSWERTPTHPRHPFGQLVLQHDHEVLVATLNRLAIELAGLDILDVGCRNGERLRYLVELGADPHRLAGIDPSARRIRAAQRANPAVCWIHDAKDEFPFPPNCFDMVLQSMIFSGIPEEEDRLSLARRMSRVVRPGGRILWIDRKRDGEDGSKGFSRAKVRDYFPDGKIVYARSVRPRYFATLHRRGAWLARSFYRVARLVCDARLIVFEMNP
jgi:SAM-dependent methyltransferase